MNSPTFPLNPAPAPRLLPRPGDGDADLSPGQRRLVVAAILAAHAAGGWALLQVDQVREAVREAAPMFVDLLAPPAPPVPRPPPPRAVPQPIQKRPVPMIAAAPSPAPAPSVVEAPPEIAQPPAAPAPVAVVEAPAVPAPPPAPPRMIPASAIQYLVPPAPEYPRLSRRNGEAGTVIVRAFADESGVPHEVQVEKSSGFARLDEAAMVAVRKTRFKPYTENGKPVAGWVRMPFPFELEK